MKDTTLENLLDTYYSLLMWKKRYDLRMSYFTKMYEATKDHKYLDSIEELITEYQRQLS